MIRIEPRSRRPEAESRTLGGGSSLTLSRSGFTTKRRSLSFSVFRVNQTVGRVRSPTKSSPTSTRTSSLPVGTRAVLDDSGKLCTTVFHIPTISDAWRESGLSGQFSHYRLAIPPTLCPYVPTPLGRGFGARDEVKEPGNMARADTINAPRGGKRIAARARAAIGYVRRSTDRQEQSIPDQKKAIEKYNRPARCDFGLVTPQESGVSQVLDSCGNGLADSSIIPIEKQRDRSIEYWHTTRAGTRRSRWGIECLGGGSRRLSVGIERNVFFAVLDSAAPSPTINYRSVESWTTSSAWQTIQTAAESAPLEQFPFHRIAFGA